MPVIGKGTQKNIFNLGQLSQFADDTGLKFLYGRYFALIFLEFFRDFRNFSASRQLLGQTVKIIENSHTFREMCKFLLFWVGALLGFTPLGGPDH